MEVKFKQWTGKLVKQKYSNGRTALQIISTDEYAEPIATCTVNIPEFPLLDNEVIIKDYSENVGMYYALIDANVIEPTKKQVVSGFVVCPVGILTKEVLEL